MAITNVGYDEKILNKAFIDAARNGDMRKCAAAGELYIRTRMREAPFSRKILPPIEVTKEDCQRSLHHDTLSIMKDIAPNAEAVSLTFRGQPDHEYITGKRFEIGFFKIKSKRYEKDEAELLAYEMPITQLIEEDVVKMMQKEEDKNFMDQVNDIVVHTGKNINITTSDHLIDKNSIIELRKQLDGDELETACMLMSKTTFLDLSRFNSDIVDNMAGDFLINGYKSGTLLGVPVYVTLKEDLVKHNEVYAFAAPEYLGYFYTLGQPKFWVKSEEDIFQFTGWELIGIGFGNIRGMAKLTIH